MDSGVAGVVPPKPNSASWVAPDSVAMLRCEHRQADAAISFRTHLGALEPHHG